MKTTIAGLLAAFLLLLGGCSSPPKPPHCDGSDRHPINSTRSSAANVAADACAQG